MSYDSSNLTTPDIKWLGVRPSDLDRFNIPQQCRLPMTDEDIKTGKRLVRHSCADKIPLCNGGPPYVTCTEPSQEDALAVHLDTGSIGKVFLVCALDCA